MVGRFIFTLDINFEGRLRVIPHKVMRTEGEPGYRTFTCSCTTTNHTYKLDETKNEIFDTQEQAQAALSHKF